MNRLKALGKDLTRSEAVRAVLCWLIAVYVRLVYHTSRWEVVGGETPRGFWERGRPFIVTFWHGRLLMMPPSWETERPIHMLISQHRDGRIIARTMDYFGIGTVAGSSSKGGSAALRAMLRALKAGECVGITPDGPRGPRMRASAGVVNVARLSRAPVLTVTFATRRRKVLGSWDRFIVALPFTRGVFVWGRPIEVPHDADPETQERFRREIEDEMNAVAAAADRHVGAEVIDPAPLPQATAAHGA
ncbi:MAG: lysophospholipid acyltransferase family protein [Alphaproteobacteria bacterium]|nr:lysophospholipid acyltransferase family protein [Alphaproteobacteria bacterium]